MSCAYKSLIHGLNRKIPYLFMCGSLRAGLNDETAVQQLRRQNITAIIGSVVL
jgi:hypothetical protein